MKIVINKNYGSFQLSIKARRMLEKLGIIVDEYGGHLGEDGKTYDYEIARNDPRLVKVVKKLGPYKSHADGKEGDFLKIVKIPDDVDWEIKNYDGIEWIAEKHRTWK